MSRWDLQQSPCWKTVVSLVATRCQARMEQAMKTCHNVTYDTWVCPRCKGPLDLEEGKYRCGRCKVNFGHSFGIPDFRLNNYDSENQLLLAKEYIDSWEELTYEDMVRMRFSGARHRALAAGKNPSDLKMLDLDEEAHLASYRTRGIRHVKLVSNALGRMGQSTHVPRLIDVGCGWGRDLLHLATMADEVIGVDVSTFSLLLTRKLLQENGISNVTLVLAEGQSLPLPPSCVDGINSSATIEHFPVPGDFLRECSRSLCESGWLFLYYPNRFSALPETHTGIWGLGFWSQARQKTIVRKRIGGEWDTTLFSRGSFTRLLHCTCEHKRVVITGMPDGIEEFCYTSKFAEMFPTLARSLQFVLPAARVIPGLDRLVSFFAPVHFVAVTR